MKLRYVSLAEPRSEKVADSCPTCRATLLAPGALRCRVLTDLVRDNVTHEEEHADELQWDNTTGDLAGDLREPMEWRCAACDTLICPTRPARRHTTTLAAIAGALAGAGLASIIQAVSSWSASQPIEAPLSTWWSIVPSPAALPQIMLVGTLAVLFFVVARGRGPRR